MNSISKEQALLEEVLRQQQVGNLPEAERACRRILRLRPSHPKANYFLGLILTDQGRLAEAEAALRRSVATAPNSLDGQIGLGWVLLNQEKLDEAEAAFRRALKLEPDAADALAGLGGVLFHRGAIAESVPYYRRSVSLTYGRRQRSPAPREPEPPHKVRHDQEQRAYLNIGNEPRPGASIMFNLEEGGRVPGRAVNPDCSGGELARLWQVSSPQVAVIDNLLSEAALDKLRSFCLRSTIWHQVFANGYLGAMPEDGFACPLIVQIADELRSTYPAIVGDNRLTRCWAFKYDSRLKGINIHADFAAVNVNFWITPDEANLDPESGGLVIWDKPAPAEWSFAEINNGGPLIRNFLEQSNAKSVTVPHRTNRAVIFDSDLFHETDRINFKEGYPNRRINITMLYGFRAAVTHGQ
jgi:tetratricopeptide (TPR) repeat protein